MGRDRREGNRKEKRGGRRSRDLKVEEEAGICRRGGRRSRDLQERWKKEQGFAGEVEERRKKEQGFEGGRRSMDVHERWKKEHGCAGKVDEGAGRFAGEREEEA